MPDILLEQPQEVLILDSQSDNGHRFFDPRKPEQPDQVFGVDTEAILRLGKAVTAMGALPAKVNVGLYTLPDAIRILPLIEEMQSGLEISPSDIRPYRKPIKNLSLGVSFADKLAATASVVAVGVPLRRALNSKIEREFPDRAVDAIDKAREAVASIEHEVDLIASFENPREQFVSELDDIAQTVGAAVKEQRDKRVNGNILAEETPEAPKGIAGFITKAVRKIKEFFGFIRKKPVVNIEVTAYDAGVGLQKTFNSFITNQKETARRFPMFSEIVFKRIPDVLPLTVDRLALIAPEILNFLFSTSPEDIEADKLKDSIIRNPHELRFVTRFKKHYGRYSLEGIQYASNTLMPAIRDVLPTKGDKVQDIYAQAQELLRYRQDNSEPEHSEVIEKGARSRFRSYSNKIRNKKE